MAQESIFLVATFTTDATEQQPSGEGLSAQASFDIIKLKPSPYPLIRIGGDKDGAYLVPDDLSGI